MTQHFSLGWGCWSGSHAKKHRAVIVVTEASEGRLQPSACTVPLSDAGGVWA